MIVLSEGYAQLYEQLLTFYRPRVSEQGFCSLVQLFNGIFKWFEEQEIRFENATVIDAMRFQAYLSEKTTGNGSPLANGTLCNYIKAAKKIGSYLISTGCTVSNPFAELVYPKIGQHISRNFLTEAQMNKLLEVLAQFDRLPTRPQRLERYRAHVVCELLYASGLRIGEAAALYPCDIDTKKRLIYVRKGKGGMARTAFLTGYACDVLDLYVHTGRLSCVSRGWRKNTDRLFAAHRQSLSSAVNHELKRVCTSLELPVITCHGLRHSLGTHLLHAHCDMRHIQAILGHDKLSTTQVYTRVYRDDLKNSIDAFHPRQFKKGLIP